MMMVYQEKFELNRDSATYFSSQIEIIICGLRSTNDLDKRFTHVKDLLKDFTGIIIYLRSDENANSLEFAITDYNGNIIDSQSGLFLIPGLRKFLRANKVEGSSICIDITCLQQPIMFLLIKLLLSEVKPRLLFAAYTEPQKYIQTQKQVLEGEDYELYDRIVGCNYSVPGFSKINRGDNELLIAPFGFERQRLISIYESVEPKAGIIPILGFPSFVPGWNLTALYMNYKAISDSGSEQLIKYCEASSPFSLYQLLEELYEIYGDKNSILIAPLGTRPHSLGAALFATKYTHCHLIYDFPVEKLFRSEHILKANIYHLTQFIQ